MALIEKIKSQVGIAEVLRKYANLAPNGKGMCPCPLHKDESPSFKIYNDKTFYCFGCNRRGDIIDLCAGINNIDMSKAITLLAKDYGITDDEHNDEDIEALRRQKREEREKQEFDEKRKQAISKRIIERIRRLRITNYQQWVDKVADRGTYEQTRRKIEELENYYLTINGIGKGYSAYEQEELLLKIINKQIVI